MGSRLDTEHDVFVRENSGDGIDTAGDGFAQEHDIRPDPGVLDTEKLASSCDTCAEGKRTAMARCRRFLRHTSLDLVADQKHVVLGAKFPDLLQVFIVRDNDTGFSLNRLHQEGSNLVAVRLESDLKVFGVVVPDWPPSEGAHWADAGKIRSVVVAGFGIGRHGNRGKSAAVEIFGHGQDNRLVLRNTLNLVTPLACNFEAGLDRLRTSVHRENHVVTEVLANRQNERAHGKREDSTHLGDKLGEYGEHIVVERSRRQSEPLGLLDECTDNLGMAVSLVNSGVSAQEIEIFVSLPACSHNTLAMGQTKHATLI